jgi:hypothetical protein
MTTEPTTDTPDAQAYAHWYEAAQTAQREVARLTAALDKARECAINNVHIADRAIEERDAERREKTHRFALRRELEEALGVGDSYADGALEMALARIAVLRTVEADRDRLRRELDEALAGREREYARAEAEHDAAARIASEWAASSERVTVCEPCHRCWGPTLAGSLVCGECADDAKGGAT